jgi:hypothetical protein
LVCAAPYAEVSDETMALMSSPDPMPVEVISALALAGVDVDDALDAVFAAVLPVVLLVGDMTELIKSLSAVRAEP